MVSLLFNVAAYVVPFLCVLTLVVTIHELGHFLMARAFGIAVDRFSINFGRALASWKDRWGVEWRIGWIPLGGYVRFRGDAEASSSVPDKDDLADLRQQIVRLEGEAAVKHYFHFRPIWQRALVVLAGPVANFVLAVALFTLLLLTVGAQVVTPRVGSVLPDSPASRAGFQTGDLITRMNGAPVDDFGDIAQFVMLRAGEPIGFDVRRGAATVHIVATPERREESDGLTGRKAKVGVLGLRASGDPRDTHRRRYGPAAAVAGGVRLTGNIVSTTVLYISHIFEGRESGDQLGGPVRMAQMSGALAKASVAGPAPVGFKLMAVSVNLLNLAAFLSVGLGFMNLMPVPVLDGGHLVFYALEAATRRPLDARVQAVSYRVGLMLLLGLMLFATWNDLRQLSLFKMIAGSFS